MYFTTLLLLIGVAFSGQIHLAGTIGKKCGNPFKHVDCTVYSDHTEAAKHDCNLVLTWKVHVSQAQANADTVDVEFCSGSKCEAWENVKCGECLHPMDTEAISLDLTCNLLHIDEPFPAISKVVTRKV